MFRYLRYVARCPAARRAMCWCLRYVTRCPAARRAWLRSIAWCAPEPGLLEGSGVCEEQHPREMLVNCASVLSWKEKYRPTVKPASGRRDSLSFSLRETVSPTRLSLKERERHSDCSSDATFLTDIPDDGKTKQFPIHRVLRTCRRCRVRASKHISGSPRNGDCFRS